MLQGKNILLGVSGSIAAYKAAFLTRLLIKAGANVRIIMTSSAKEFITPLTLGTLSKNPVLSVFSDPDTGTWNNHVELGIWADVLLIAPATANTLAKMANGICDDLLHAAYLSARCPVFVAPAMDLDMFKHSTTRENLAKLKKNGVHLIDPGIGELASGLEGEGRMAEPEQLFSVLEKYFSGSQPLKGKKALVTAGPTHEPIDPVRFIGNNSSGKMGFAIAERLAERGAEVTLICGPNSLSCSGKIKRVDVVSADEMYAQVMKISKETSILVLAAAVADFRPSKRSNEKIKKSGKDHSIDLELTRDIAEELGKKKNKRQFIAGFALETNDEIKNAKEKLRKKNFDMIVLNSLRDKGAGFGYDTNRIKILDKNNKTVNFELKSKSNVAIDIVNYIISKTK